MDVAGHRTLYGELASHTRRKPDFPWLSFEEEGGRVRRWTAAQFLATVHQAAGWLRKNNLRTGEVVALAAGNHPAHVQLALASSFLGVTVLLVDPASSPEESRYLLEHSLARLVVGEKARIEVLRTAAAGLPSLRRVLTLSEYEEETLLQAADPPGAAAKPGGVVQLLYTSGTTSRPKGVMLTDSAFIYGAEVFRASTGLREDDHHLIALPLFHAAAQCHALWPSLVASCRVTLLPRFSASRFFEQAARHGATMAALFGAPLRFLLNQPVRPADREHRLRNVTFAQNLASAQYEEWHRRFGAPLQQLWGMTETCSLPVMSPLTGERRLEAMGRPVLGYEVRVVDEEGREVPPGEPGQLITRGVPGRSLMLGYLRNPEATRAALRTIDGAVWMFSGDTVRADEDGYLHFVERSKDLIKRGGENVSCTEVEGVIAQMPGVAEACVVGLPDPNRDELVAAVIVARPGAAITLEAVQAWCRPRLAAYKAPERVFLNDELPRTSVGKLQRQVVRQRLERSSASIRP